jgi:excisionase family DNA binding protein
MNEALDPSEGLSSGGPTPASATPGAATITRREVAAELGVDERTVRRMAEDGRLTAVMGPDGVRRFHAEQVREVTIQRRVSSSLTVESHEAEVAATLYALFDEGVHPADAVQRARLHPRVVREMHREWAEMRGGMFVPEKQLMEMCACFGLPTPIRRPEDLVEGLQRNWPTGVCSRCNTDEPTLCVACVAVIKVLDAKRQAVEREMERQARGTEMARASMKEGLFARRKMRARRNETGDDRGKGSDSQK